MSGDSQAEQSSQSAKYPPQELLEFEAEQHKARHWLYMSSQRAQRFAAQPVRDGTDCTHRTDQLRATALPSVKWVHPPVLTAQFLLPVMCFCIQLPHGFLLLSQTVVISLPRWLVLHHRRDVMLKQLTDMALKM